MTAKEEEAKLKKQLRKHPGLEDKLAFLHDAGIVSWSHLGSLDDVEWRQAQEKMAQKRLWKGGDDIRDPQRLGPGHMMSFDHLHYNARRAYLGDLNNRVGGDEC